MELVGACVVHAVQGFIQKFFQGGERTCGTKQHLRVGGSGVCSAIPQDTWILGHLKMVLNCVFCPFLTHKFPLHVHVHCTLIMLHMGGDTFPSRTRPLVLHMYNVHVCMYLHAKC